MPFQAVIRFEKVDKSSIIGVSAADNRTAGIETAVVHEGRRIVTTRVQDIRRREPACR